jgi:hypothetical protein
MKPIGLALASVAISLLAATTAAGQTVVTITQLPLGTTPILGSVLAGSAATTFSVSNSGVVTQSGNAIRMTSAPVTVPTYTVTCTGSLLCVTNTMRITVAVAGASGPATITALRVGNMTTGLYLLGIPPLPSSSMFFDLLPLAAPITFTLGMDVLLPASAPAGTDTFTYTVTATRL